MTGGEDGGKPLWLQRYRQFIPRPQGAVVGDTAPWAELPASARRPITLDRIAGALESRLAPPEEEPANRPHAAVLVPIFERDGEAMIVLIRRSFMLASNPGDLAFPGGRLEPGERAVDAAVREAEEEVALKPDEMRVLGRLGDVNRPRARGSVVPYVALLPAEPRLHPDPIEVDGIFKVSLADLVEDGRFWEEEWLIPEQGSRVLSFFAHPTVLGEDVIWGMTAMILRELLSEVLLVG